MFVIILSIFVDYFLQNYDVIGTSVIANFPFG